MNINDAVLDHVRRADPLDGAEVLEWSRSIDAQQMLDVVAGPNIAPARPRRTRTRWRLAVASVAVTGGLTTAAVASGVLGDPPPDRVRDHLAGLDDGMPDDLRLNPDLDHARAVAITPSGVLYAADLRDGGYCMEVVTDTDRPRGAACLTAAHVADRALEVTAPIPSGPSEPLLVGGRINDDRIERIVIRSASGQSTDVEIGLERYWLFEVPFGQRDDALNSGLIVSGIDGDDQEVFNLTVPPLRDEDPLGTNFDDAQPIFVSTISSSEDLTLVLGVEGSVNVADAANLELQYPDGTTDALPIRPDGDYRFMLAADRQDDFATATGVLIARNAAGEIVATAPVTSVAHSRRSG